ncbi:MAG: tetratricopeptide repeat protein [Opitutaceae bacterium]
MTTAPPPDTRDTGRGPPGGRWPLRVLLMAGAPLAFALALEGTLRVAGYGERTDLFIPDGAPGYYRTNPHFTAPYFPAQFDITPLNFRISRHKEPGRLRIFVLGESAARGTPEPGFGFAALLQAQLRHAYPGRRFEVFNLGIVAINSHVVYQAARQAAEFEPDLFVVYMGNNEAVGPYGPGSVSLSATPHLSVIRASIWVRGTRTGQLIAALLGRLSGATERPDDWRGMSTFTEKTVRGDDPRLEAEYRNYEANLRDIVAIASGKGIRVVLATVVANLRDCPPFASLHRPGMTSSESGAWEAAYARATRLWELGLPDDAIDAANAALRIDPGYAEAHFVLGRLLMDKGDAPAARGHFLEAIRWDGLRFRPDARINAIARGVAADSPGAVVLLDSALEMGSDAASGGLPAGREALLEHVHFNWAGNVRMGRMLAEKAALALFGRGAPPADWLGEPACADAVGYTDYGRLEVLRLMEPIWGRPPFTGQLTFAEDQVRHARDMELAAAGALSGEGLSRARGQIEAALLRDPDDPGLSLRLSEVEFEAHRPDRSLQLLDRVLELEPRAPDLLLARSRALAALGRYREAQAAVLESLRTDRHHLPSYTALVDVLRRTADFETGRATLSAALAADPGSSYIRLTYADLLFFHGDRDAAVRECRGVLARDPGNPDALRRLVSLFGGEGRKDEAFALMTQARSAQPLNYENLIALARTYRERGDDERVADCLQAAARCGPADAQIHLYLASRLGRLNRPSEALVELARARRIAALAGDAQLAQRISEEMRPGGAGRRD